MSPRRYSLYLWLVSRFMKKGREQRHLGLTLTTLLSLTGLILGVGTLALTMSIVNGVDVILKSAVIDLYGHVQVLRSGGGLSDPERLKAQIQNIVSVPFAATPFLQVEALIAGRSGVLGVSVQGVDPQSVHDVLRFKSRLIEGVSDFQGDSAPGALVGKELAKRFGLKIGQTFQMVVAKSNLKSATGFSPRSQSFVLKGVMDFGKYEFNARTVMTSSEAAQNLAGIGKFFSGLRLRFARDDQARDEAYKLSQGLGYGFWVKDWYEVNENYFSAVEIEKRAIFLVLLLMVVVASLNVSSTMLINVLNRYSDIATLKTLGATEKQITVVFLGHGLALGLVGTCLGVLLGLVVAFVVSHWSLVHIPADVYKFDRLPMDVRWSDMGVIFFTSMLICAFASWLPARRGAKLRPVEGLRYE